MSNENTKEQEFLNKKLDDLVAEKTEEENKVEETEVEDVEEEIKESEETENTDKKSKKGLIVALIALVLAGAAAIGCMIGLKKKNNDSKKDINDELSVEESLEESLEESIAIGIGELGFEEELSSIIDTNNQYGEVTGNINKEDLVTEGDKNYKDEEAVENLDQVGKEEIDLKDDSLVIGTDGNVYEKEEGFEIKDQDGNVIASGDNESQIEENSDYVYDEELDKIVVQEDANKFVYVDADYYDMNGELIYYKGEIVLKETLEKIKNDQNLTTIKPDENISVEVPEENISVEIPEENISVEENVSGEITPETDVLGGVVNEDGTYTIYGTTYMDQATFIAFIEDENSLENFGLYEGIIYPVEVINELHSQKSK